MHAFQFNAIPAMIEARQSELRADFDASRLSREASRPRQPVSFVLARLSLFRRSVQPTATRRAA
jgi:hypothetical protein